MVQKIKLRKEPSCVCFNLRKASRAITLLYDEQLRPTGLRVTQVSILNSIKRFEPVTVNQLAGETITDRTTLTRNLEVLRRKGLIRITSGKDRRRREIKVTRSGQISLENSYRYWKHAQDQVIKSLGKKRVQSLVRELSSMVKHIRQGE